MMDLLLLHKAGGFGENFLTHLMMIWSCSGWSFSFPLRLANRQLSVHCELVSASWQPLWAWQPQFRRSSARYRPPMGGSWPSWGCHDHRPVAGYEGVVVGGCMSAHFGLMPRGLRWTVHGFNFYGYGGV